jgi:hypothetical protein
MCDAKTAATGLQLVGTYTSAKGAVDVGQAQANELQYKAAQEKAIAGQEMAAGSQKVADTAFAGQVLESRMRAAAGASGVDMVSPTVVGLVSKAAGLTQFNQDMEMYNATSSANKATDQAKADIYSAGQAVTAGRTKAFGTILSGASSIYNNYRSPTR